MRPETAEWVEKAEGVYATACRDKLLIYSFTILEMLMSYCRKSKS
jgi:hypothetical protein